MNLFVALGPVTLLNNIKVPLLREISRDWRQIEYLAVKVGAFNLMNFGWLEEDAVQALCNEFAGICDALIRYVAYANTEVDNMDRYDVFLKDFPSGTGYRNIVYYAQSIQNIAEWYRYDYGHIGNMEHYHQANPPLVPLD